MIDIHSYAVIGLKIMVTNLLGPLEKAPAFEHKKKYPKSQKFCPDSGRELWEDVRRPIKQFIPAFNAAGGDNRQPLLFGVSVIECWDNWADDMDPALIKNQFVVVPLLATQMANSDGITSIRLPDDLAEQVNNFRTQWKSRGLWVEKNFGLHCVFYEKN